MGFKGVAWAMTKGITEHPEWYGGLTSFEDFQKKLHQLGRDGCAMPCARRILEFSANKGFCCATRDSCGTCLEKGATQSDAVKDADDYCATKDSCGACGTWCRVSTKYTCVTSGADSADWCGSAYPDSIVASDNFCAQDQASCESCNGKLCASSKIEGDEPEAEESTEADTKEPETGSICVFSSEDPADVCGTARLDSAAEADNFCAKDKDSCESCSGHWCGKGSAKNEAKEKPKDEDKDEEEESEAEDSIEPDAEPKKAEDCGDVQPPSAWSQNTCQAQKDAGNRDASWFASSGYCKQTCGLCQSEVKTSLRR